MFASFMLMAFSGVKRIAEGKPLGSAEKEVTDLFLVFSTKHHIGEEVMKKQMPDMVKKWYTWFKDNDPIKDILKTKVTTAILRTYRPRNPEDESFKKIKEEDDVFGICSQNKGGIEDHMLLSMFLSMNVPVVHGYAGARSLSIGQKIKHLDYHRAHYYYPSDASEKFCYKLRCIHRPRQ